MTKSRAVVVDFAKQVARLQTFNSSLVDTPSPVNYSPERFYNFPKEVPNYSIGVKRETVIEQRPGPGEYNMNSELTKSRIVGKHTFGGSI